MEIKAGTIWANGLEFGLLEAGGGPLALCLHGFPDTARTWRYLLPELAAAGQTPGTAQLAPTASTRPASPAESNTTNSPVRASTAVTLSTLAGQSLTGSRASNTLRRSASGMVRAASAQWPIRARARTGSRLVLMTHSSL
ncbi:MAG: alpha/beta fold hydrolase, partial [Streptosporangiaceae bacterium]